MRRRPLLCALLGTGGVSALSGCNGLFGGEPGPPRSTAEYVSDSARTGTSSAATGDPGPTTGPPTPEPYRSSGPALDSPRGVHVRNLASTDRFLTLVLTDDGAEVFVESLTVPAGETASFPGLLGTGGRYEVLVETADGSRESYDWEVSEPLDDLWVDLTPGIEFARAVRCLADCSLVVPDAERVVAYDVPDSVGVSEALGRVPAVVLDNDATRPRRASVRVWNRTDRRLALSYDVPPDVRVVVPVLPGGPRYRVAVETPEGEAEYDWLSSVRPTLYASLDSRPTFRCGYVDRDLLVRNETPTDRTIRVQVLTGEETLFERSFTVAGESTRRVPSAVDPNGPLRFRVATADGLRETYDWTRCAPPGPITVAVGENGVFVSVSPDRDSS